MNGYNLNLYGHSPVNQIFSLFMGLISTYYIVALAIAILGVVSKWIIFVKAKEKGWKSLIPVYSKYIEYKVFWNKYMFYLQIILALLGAIIIYYGTFNAKAIFVTIGSLMILSITLIRYIQIYKKAKYFNQSGSFAVGLYFLPYIFNIILAFDKNCKHSLY